jgi:hypothetical protein
VRLAAARSRSRNLIRAVSTVLTRPSVLNLAGSFASTLSLAGASGVRGHLDPDELDRPDPYRRLSTAGGGPGLHRHGGPGPGSGAGPGRRRRCRHRLAEPDLEPPGPAPTQALEPAVDLAGHGCCKIAVVDDDWKYEYDRILGQTTSLLAQRGDEQAVALLVDVRSMDLVSTDEAIRTEKVFNPWIDTGDDSPVTMTVYRRAAVLDIDDYLVSRFTEDICQRVAETLSYVAERNGELDVFYVRPRPALPEQDDNWRVTHAARLASDRPSTRLGASLAAPGILSRMT